MGGALPLEGVTRVTLETRRRDAALNYVWSLRNLEDDLVEDMVDPRSTSRWHAPTPCAPHAESRACTHACVHGDKTKKTTKKRRFFPRASPRCARSALPSTPLRESKTSESRPIETSLCLAPHEATTARIRARKREISAREFAGWVNTVHEGFARREARLVAHVGAHGHT